MKFHKKMILFITMLCFFSITSIQSMEQTEVLDPEVELISQEPTPDAPKKSIPKFGVLKGTVQSVANYPPAGKDNALQHKIYTVYVGDVEDENIVNIIGSDLTYREKDDGEILRGSVIYAFYNMDAPFPLIYPPQYVARAIIVDKPDRYLKMDFFDSNLTSLGNELKLNVDDLNTTIVDENNQSYTGSLANKYLMVMYSVETKSIPPQTTPEKIVVFNEQLDPETLVDPEINEDQAIRGFMVNNQTITGYSPYMEDGNIIVPVRATAEALGMSVKWVASERKIILDDTIELYVGVDQARKGYDVLNLAKAPFIMDDHAYISTDFFKDFLHYERVSVENGMLFIDKAIETQTEN